MRTIEKLFGKSPFEPMVEHTRRVHATVELVRPFLEAYLAEEWERCEELHDEVSRLEHEADTQKNEIRDHLPKSLFLPVDRSDLLAYLKQQDAIADSAEDLAVLLTLRNIETPDELGRMILDFADQVIRTSELLLEAGLELTDLFAASFEGPEVDRVLKMVAEVNDQEWEADKRERRVTRTLLTYENGMDAIDLLLWMRALDALGEVANHAENTGDLLRRMLARQ
jgi:predicted phosphate transport protein (TIGR00153 family)